MTAIRYGVQIQITGGGWVWLKPDKSLTYRPIHALSYPTQPEAAEVRDYLAETRPSQQFRVTKLYGAPVPRG